MEYVALIPSYEPNEKLFKIVKELKDNDFNIVVVNDGSDSSFDHYFEDCKKYTEVLGYETNMGKGYALKHGLEFIKNKFKDVIVVTMDSDGQHTVPDAIKLCEYVSLNKNVICLGKRIRGEGTPVRSKIGNFLSAVFFKLITNAYIYDTQTGLRAFDVSQIDFLLSVEGNRFDYEMNVLLEATRSRIKLKEITIQTIYENNNKGSHFKAFRDSFRIFKGLFKFSLVSLLSFILDYSLFVLSLFFTSKVLISNLVSRGVSSLFNYFCNKKYVFKNNDAYSFYKYYLLVLIILGLNSLLLTSFVYFGINKYIAKIIVEFILFLFSFKIQDLFIFTNKKK